MKKLYLAMALVGLCVAHTSWADRAFAQTGQGSTGSPYAPRTGGPVLNPASEPSLPAVPGTAAPGENRTPTSAEPGATPDNPTSRQEPATTLEWIGPPTAQVGKQADYTLAVRNASGSALQSVVVHVRVSDGTAFVDRESRVMEGNTQKWELGTMQPRERRNLQVRLLPGVGGDFNCVGWVTFTGSSAIRVPVRQPMLELKVTSPGKDILVGETAGFVFTVSNPGTMETDSVKIQAILSDGLNHANGKQISFDLGSLAAGEKRSVQVLCAASAVGPQRCDGIAYAGGSLRAEDGAGVTVVMPRLELDVSGPAFRYLNRRGEFVFKVTNTGSGTAQNVMISDTVPAGFKFLAASGGGQHDFATRTVSWNVGELPPGQTREVRLELLAINPGEFWQKATATATRGAKMDKELLTRVEGVSAILAEVVDLEDPVAVGEETTYEIRVTNTGSKAETNVRVVCWIPDQVEFKVASGPAVYHAEGKAIIFEPLPKLPPRADAFYRICVRSRAAGDARFRTEITSTNLVEPVIKMEATRIYADQPEEK